jgi:SAM-dependent methyltransferase
MELRARWSQFRSWFYDAIIVAMTATWYRAFLNRVPMDAEILDVGIGTGTGLLHNRDLVVSKRLHVVGIDIDQDYVDAARLNVARCRLGSHVEIICTTNYQGGPFDAIYFSGSFMIIPNKVEFLKRMRGMLRSSEHSRVYFSQTLEKPGIVGAIMTWLKPTLKWLTTIDFGTVTYRRNLEAHIVAAGFVVEDLRIVKPGYFRDQVLVIAKASD